MRKNYTLRITIAGIIFGLSFPIGSLVLLMIQNQMPLNLQSLIAVHQQNPIQWMVDTAPLVIGFISFLGGRQYNRSMHLNEELESLVKEREQLVNQLKNLTTSLKRQTERRFVQLQTAAQVAQEANNIHDLDTLLNQIVHLVSDRFGFYHVGIFMNDRLNEYSLLQAANSEGGQRMLARNHKLRVGEVGIVGYVASKGEPRIALDVGEDAVYFDNPDLPETRSEMALPIKIAGKVVGVLDIQSRQSGAFDEDDVTVLQTIADSLGTAIENARLLSELQSNLNEIRTLHRQYLGRAWSHVAPAEKPIEYAFQRPVQVDENLLQRVEFPLKIRDLEIGAMTIEKEAQPAEGGEIEPWTTEQLNLIEKVCNQMALTLENARLLEESQRLARREQQINLISSQISSSVNLEAILQNTVRELGKALGASKTFIQVGAQDTPPLETVVQAEESGNSNQPTPSNGRDSGDHPEEDQSSPALGSF